MTSTIKVDKNSVSAIFGKGKLDLYSSVCNTPEGAVGFVGIYQCPEKESNVQEYIINLYFNTTEAVDTMIDTLQVVRASMNKANKYSTVRN